MRDEFGGVLFFTFLLLEPWIKRLKINEGEGDNLQAVGTLAARESHYLVPTFPGVHEKQRALRGEGGRRRKVLKA